MVTNVRFAAFRHLTATICLAIAVLLGSSGTSFALPPCDKGFEILFACSLEIIEETWVDLSGSTLLKAHQREFHNLLRLRIRNDLSMFRLGNQTYGEFLIKHSKSGDAKSLKRETQKRATLSCKIMTVGDSYPVAQYTECELSGWGEYSGPYPSYKGRMLGYSNAQESKQQVMKSMRTVITSISSQLLERRDEFTNR